MRKIWAWTGALALLVTACGGGGGGGTPPPPAAARITAFAATPPSVVAGTAASLSWSTTGATACSLNGAPVAAAGGTQATGALNATTNFTLSCQGLGGNDSRVVTVAVTPPPTAVSISSLLADPATIASGGASTVRWSVLRATACTLNGTTVAADNGSLATGAVTATTRYTLACSNATSTDSRAIDVTVLPAVAAGWTRLADMPVALAKFGVAEINGQLVVAGGYDTLTTVYLYDIAADQWRTGPSLPRGSDNLAMVAAGGRVYALGGEARNAVQVYDPIANAWSSGPAIPTIRFASAVAVVDGRIHIAGGWNYNNATTGSLATHDVFDTAVQTWAAAGSAAPMPTARNAAGGAAIDGRFYVAAGRAPGIRSNDNTPLAALEIYTPGTNSWAAGPGAPTARGSVAAAALGGRLYVFGGEAGAAGVTDAVERYDVTRGTWDVMQAMPYRAHGQGAVAVGNAIYVMGGFTGSSDAVGTASRALYRYVPPN
jgi:hypothetical protein